MLHLPDGFSGATDPSAWISDDRILACLGQASGGVDELLYHGPQPQAGNTWLLRGAGALTWGAEAQAEDGWRRIPHRLAGVSLHPHACETLTADGGLSLSAWIGLADGALLIALRFENAGPAPLDARCWLALDEAALWSGVRGRREWSGPAFTQETRAGMLRFSARDRLHTLEWINVPGFTDARLDTRVHCWLTAAGPLAYAREGRWHRLVTQPIRLQAGERAEPGVFVCLCGGQDDEMRVRAARLAALWTKLAVEQSGRYRAAWDGAPRIRLPGRPGLEAAFRSTPGYAEAAKVRGTGAIRASCGGDYFVWGWDSLVSGHEFYRWGDAPAMRDMARFFETHRAADGSIPHRYDNQLQVLQATGYDFNTQLYISLVYHAWAHARDRAWLADRYPLVREMFERMADLADERGMFPCLGMYPDAPEKLGREPTHFIAEEQGFWHSVCRMMERLARQAGDDGTAARARDIGARVERHFLPAFYDPQAGFLADSIAPDGARNGTHPLWALMAAHTADGIEMLQPRWRELADFIETRLMSERGVNMTPDDDPHYGTETVTTSCWFMHFDAYVLRLLRRAGRGAAILRWLDLAEGLYQEYRCVPELTRTGPAWLSDGRHQEAGQRWQMFAAAGWYRALVEGVVGLEHDVGGVTAIPADLALDVALTGHRYGKSTWDVEVDGRGAWWGGIVLDGRPVEGSCKLPADCMDGGRHTVRLTRSPDAPDLPVLMAAPGAAVTACGYEDGALRVALAGDGPASVRVWSRRPIRIRWGDSAIFDAAPGDARVELDLRGAGVLRVEG